SPPVSRTSSLLGDTVCHCWETVKSTSSTSGATRERRISTTHFPPDQRPSASFWHRRHDEVDALVRKTYPGMVSPDTGVTVPSSNFVAVAPFFPMKGELSSNIAFTPEA